MTVEYVQNPKVPIPGGFLCCLRPVCSTLSMFFADFCLLLVTRRKLRLSLVYMFRMLRLSLLLPQSKLERSTFYRQIVMQYLADKSRP